VAISDRRKLGMAKKVIATCGGAVRGKTVGLLGLAFNPTPTTCATHLRWPWRRRWKDAGATLRGYDPEAMPQAKSQLPDAVFCQDAYDCAAGAEALVVVTEWDMFRALHFERLGEVME